MLFNDLLALKGIDPADVIVFRHRPFEPELRKVLPWLAAERPKVYNAYQQAQWPKAEKAMTKARYVASFIGHEARKAVFVGLFRIHGSKSISRSKFWQIPENEELKSFGLTGMTKDRRFTLWFNLVCSDFYRDWKGKLIVRWPGPELAWWRWGHKNVFHIDAVVEESLLVGRMPPWDELTVTREELKVLPATWKSALREWRGIYLILDSSDGRSYVGAAYGKGNILQRWEHYARSGNGGNKEMRACKPRYFRFCILERVSPDMNPDEVVRKENSWKKRLGTRLFGLNKN